jgi:peptidoglycan-associated lipoprotein
MAALAGTLVVLAGSVSCAARVKQEAFDAEMEAIRREMQQQDEQTSSRMQELEQRMGQRVDSLGRRTAELQRALTELRDEFNTRIAETEMALTFNVPVHFEFDEATLRDGDRPVLERFANVVNRYYRDALVTVEGFADPAGDPAYNIWLGEQRANSVREFLTQSGLDAARIRVVSYGEARERQVVPGAAGPGPEGLENRRVALVIDYGGETTRRVAGG